MNSIHSKTLGWVDVVFTSFASSGGLVYKVSAFPAVGGYQNDVNLSVFSVVVISGGIFAVLPVFSVVIESEVN